LVQIGNHVSQTGSKQPTNKQMNVNKSVNHTHTIEGHRPRVNCIEVVSV